MPATRFELLHRTGTHLILARHSELTAAASAAVPGSTQAATKIQSIARGAATRRALSLQHRAAQTIQSAVRGRAGRGERGERARARAAARDAAWHHAAATAIQRVFRGFLSRKYVADAKARRAYLAAVAEKGALLRSEAAAYAAASAAAAAAEEATAVSEAYLAAAAAGHHLVGTKAIPGVFAPPGKPAPISPFGDTVEESIRFAFARSAASRPAPRARPPLTPHTPSPPPMTAGLKGTTSNPVGPFKPRPVVWKQRHHVSPPSTMRAAKYGAEKAQAREAAKLDKLMRVTDADFVTALPSRSATRPPSSVRAADPYAPLRPDKLFRPDVPSRGSRPRFKTTFRPRRAFGQDPAGYNNRTS